MFFYLSFLRPPPFHANISGPIPITPQVANDLRTEPFPGSADIFYSWIPTSVQGSHLASSKATSPIKLTTWRSSNAYKSVNVLPPPGVRDGEAWKLVLSVDNLRHSGVIKMGSHTMGLNPFPVISMPIQFSRKIISSGSKQERIERIYRIPMQSKSEIDLIITEQTSFDLDKKIWDSGIGLSAWIADLTVSEPKHHRLLELKSLLLSKKKTSIIELGAGTGIVALTIAALRSSIDPHPGTLITTDLESAMPLLTHNVSQNEYLYPACPITTAVLDWEDEVLPNVIKNVSGGYQIIVMADVTYNTTFFPALIQTLSSLIALNDEPPVILMAYKERDEEERSLWNEIKRIGVVFEQVGKRPGAGGKEVEIWLGGVLKQDMGEYQYKGKRAVCGQYTNENPVC